MKIGILTKPLFFERIGGLQLQVQETVAALESIGLEPRFISPKGGDLDAFDCIHAFDVGNEDGIAWATKLGKPVVISPVMPPIWTKYKAVKATLADHFAVWLTNGRVQTNYRAQKQSMASAGRVIALSKAEAKVLTQAFGVDPARVSVVPNGVSEHFFNADPSLFLQANAVTPGFVLCVGSVYPYKNQLRLAQALEGTDLQLVIIGPDRDPGSGYFKQVCAFPHVHYAGVFAHDDPLLASAFAAAGVLAVPSVSEVFPLVVLEALAAGTPVVLTRDTALDLESVLQHVRLVDPDDFETITQSIKALLEDSGSRETRRDAMADLSWNAVALSLEKIYSDVVSEDSPNAR